MSADPSPTLIVLVLLYRLHVVSPPFVFYLSSSSPSLSLRLLTENLHNLFIFLLLELLSATMNSMLRVTLCMFDS